MIYFRIISPNDNSEDKLDEENEEDEENENEQNAAFCAPGPEEIVSSAEPYNILQKLDKFFEHRLDTTKEHIACIQKLKIATLDTFTAE